MRNLLVFFSILMACEENNDDYRWKACDTLLDTHPITPLYIDSGCKDYVIEIIENGVFKLNEFSSSTICQPLVEIVGFKDVEYSTIDVPINTITCYSKEPDWYVDSQYSTAKGSSRDFENIRLFLFKEILTDDAILSLVMHELFHYMGIDGHTDNEEDIMYTSAHWKIEYTQGDADHFCANDLYDCVGFN